MVTRIVRIIIILFLFCIASISVLSQCVKKGQITYGGDYGFVNYIHLCPTYQFAYGGDTSKKWHFQPISMSLAPKEVPMLKEYLEKEIKRYAGNSFFEKLTFNSVEVVYEDSLKAFIDRGRNVSLSNCKAKYFFYYEFKPDTIAIYHIGIALNKGGKIISKFNFPSKKDYKPFDSTFTYCKLIEIARRVQKDIDPVKSISLEYDRRKKKFYWLISQSLVKEKQGVNYFNKVLIDAVDLGKVTLSRGMVYTDY